MIYVNKRKRLSGDVESKCIDFSDCHGLTQLPVLSEAEWKAWNDKEQAL